MYIVEISFIGLGHQGKNTGLPQLYMLHRVYLVLCKNLTHDRGGH